MENEIKTTEFDVSNTPVIEVAQFALLTPLNYGLEVVGDKVIMKTEDDWNMKIFEKKCEQCGKTIGGLSTSQVDYLLGIHKKWKHGEKEKEKPVVSGEAGGNYA